MGNFKQFASFKNIMNKLILWPDEEAIRMLKAKKVIVGKS